MSTLEERLAALEASTLSMRSSLSALSQEAIRGKRYRDAGNADDLTARLDPGSLVGVPAYRRGRSSLPDLGTPLMARLRDDNMLQGISAGATDPHAGYGNLLDDPTFETVSYNNSTTIGVAYTAIGPFWEAKYVLNSGTVATTVSMVGFARAPNTLSVGSSGTVKLSLIFGANASDMTIYLRPATTFLFETNLVAAPSWTVGSFVVWSALATNVTFTARAEMVDASDVVLATSDIEDVANLLAIAERSRLSAGLQSPALATPYRLRIRLDVTKTGGSVASANAYMTEPLSSGSEDGSAPSFTPAIGMWRPGATGYQLVTRTFSYIDIPAATTTSAVRGGAGTPIQVAERWAGSIVGCGYRLSGAPTAGVLAIRVQKNGTTVWTAFSLTSASGVDGTARQLIGTDTFAVDDALSIQLDANGTYAPATRDIVVDLDLLLTYTGE